MSEVNPAPVKGGNANNRQKLILAVLATILVAVLIVFLLPTLMGGDDTDTSTPAPATATTAPAGGTPGGTPTGTPAEGEGEGEQATETLVRPTRDPFTPAPGFGQ
jgi:hypothetical protein